MAVAFSILGRGRAGKALAGAWSEHVALLPGTANPAGWVLLAVPDSQVESCAARFPGRCVHLSGSLDLPGVPCAHPLTSFDGTPAVWTGTPLALTGSVPDFIQAAFRALGFLPFPLPAELKPLYHACAVMASGHAATLWLGAETLLAQSGIQLPGQGFGPLGAATLRNIQQHGRAGRTGPFVRGDLETIARDAASLPEPWRDLFLRLGNL